MKHEPLHKTVKKMMIDKGIRQIDVVKHFNFTESYVSKALHGKRDSFLKKIAEYVSSYKIKKAA